MFFDKATDQSYLGEMKKRAEGEGVKSLLIMCDREGNLGDPDDAKRAKTVENHLKWLDAAKFLGCHSIRVNAASDAKLTCGRAGETRGGRASPPLRRRRQARPLGRGGKPRRDFPRTASG